MNNTASTFVALTSVPSMERPLFCPQYVSAIPAIVPSPADLPSCIKIIAASAIQSITNKIVITIFKISTSNTPPAYKPNISYHTHTDYASSFLFVFLRFFAFIFLIRTGKTLKKDFHILRLLPVLPRFSEACYTFPPAPCGTALPS